MLERRRRFDREFRAGAVWVVLLVVVVAIAAACTTPLPPSAAAGAATSTTAEVAIKDHCPDWLGECDEKLRRAWQEAETPTADERNRQRRLRTLCDTFATASNEYSERVERAVRDVERVLESGALTGLPPFIGVVKAASAISALSENYRAALHTWSLAVVSFGDGMRDLGVDQSLFPPTDVCVELRGAIRRSSGDRCPPTLRPGEQDCVVTWSSLEAIPMLAMLEAWERIEELGDRRIRASDQLEAIHGRYYYRCLDSQCWDLSS